MKVILGLHGVHNNRSFARCVCASSLSAVYISTGRQSIKETYSYNVSLFYWIALLESLRDLLALLRFTSFTCVTTCFICFDCFARELDFTRLAACTRIH
jgi:hypothetical protein